MNVSGVQLRRVDTLKDAQDFLEWLEQPRSILAIDTETTGRDWWVPNFTRLVQFGDCQAGWTISAKHWWSLIEQALCRVTAMDKPVVAHNAKFDMHALRAAGFSLPPRHLWHDTMLMHTLLYPLLWHGMKEACTTLIDPRWASISKNLDKAMKDNGWTWATVPYELLLYSIYGALDTVMCARLYDIMAPQIQKRFTEPYEVEMQTANIVYNLEKRGIRADLDYCEKLLGKYEEELETIAGKLLLYGINNPSSSDQVKQYLIEEEDWEPTVFTKKGNISFDAKVKDSLDFEVVDLFAEYGKRLKYSTYIDKILTMNDNGIVYPSIKTMQAVTGRMSIGSDKKEKGTGKPVAIPFQQFPHEYAIRRAILPRYDGYVLRPIDYDSQEIRVLAHFSQEPGLLQAIRDGVDLHIYTAERIYGETITKDDPRRNIAKMCRYLQVYGGGAEKLSKAVGITLAEAELFKELDNKTFPGIKTFMREVQNIGKNRFRETGRGWIESWGGRDLEVDGPKFIEGEQKEFWYKLANYIIQGSCADLLKRKMIALDSAGLMEYVDLPVHDELVPSVPDDSEGDDIAHTMKDIMEEHDAFSIPLTCELSPGYKSWGHKYLQKGELGWDETAEEPAA